MVTDLGSKLKLVWEQQRLYNKRIKEKQIRNSVEWMQTYLLGAISEVNEVLREMNWKTHRLRSPEDYTPNVPQELADVTKFVFCMWQELGYSPEQMLAEVEVKNEIMEQRWKQEFGTMPVNRDVLVLDLDGTVADFVGGFADWLFSNRERYGHLIVGTEGEWADDQQLWERSETLHMDVNFGWELNEYEIAKNEFEASGGYGALPYFDRAIRQVREAVNSGVYLVAWTARPYTRLNRVWYDSWAWLDSVGLKPDQLHIGSDDRVQACKEYMRRGNRVVLIDDNPDIAERAANNGVPTILVKHPYNRHCWDLEGLRCVMPDEFPSITDFLEEMYGEGQKD